jgi:phosphate transport system substrate-binding protein
MDFPMRTQAGAAFLLQLVVGVVLLAGCSGEPAGGNDPSGGGGAPGGAATSGGAVSLTGAGATFPYPLYSKWFDDYHGQHPDVRINYQSIGSGGGIQQLKQGTVDFGASDAPLSESEAKEMPAEVVHVPTVAGAVALIYNVKDVSTGLKLTPDALAGIFLGRIKRWNDPAIAGANPGASLPDEPIVVVHRSDGSGTTFLFSQYLAAVSPTWKQAPGIGKSLEWPAGVGGKGNEGVTGLVQQTDGAIGYVELAYAVQNRLAFAALRNRTGDFISPSVENVTAALEGAAAELAKDIRAPVVNSAASRAYPIAGLTYILAYKEQKDAAKAKALVQFLAWAIHDGQKTAPDLHYAPLPEAVVKLNEAQLKGFTANGQPLLATGASAQ